MGSLKLHASIQADLSGRTSWSWVYAQYLKDVLQWAIQKEGMVLFLWHSSRMLDPKRSDLPQASSPEQHPSPREENSGEMLAHHIQSE